MGIHLFEKLLVVYLAPVGSRTTMFIKRRKYGEKDACSFGGSASSSIDDPGGICRPAWARFAFLQHGRFVVEPGYGARQCLRSRAWAKGDVPRP